MRLKKLALVIPPPVVALSCAALMWCMQYLGLHFTIDHSIKLTICYILAITGLGLGIIGIVTFKRAQTTVNPHTPKQSSTLVQSGIYRFSRNPMYLGLLLLLTAWGIFLANLPALLILPGFVWYINQFQIKPEEAILESLFGDDFIAYTHKVRRWL